MSEKNFIGRAIAGHVARNDARKPVALKDAPGITQTRFHAEADLYIGLAVQYSSIGRDDALGRRPMEALEYYRQWDGKGGYNDMVKRYAGYLFRKHMESIDAQLNWPAKKLTEAERETNRAGWREPDQKAIFRARRQESKERFDINEEWEKVVNPIPWYQKDSIPECAYLIAYYSNASIGYSLLEFFESQLDEAEGYAEEWTERFNGRLGCGGPTVLWVQPYGEEKPLWESHVKSQVRDCVPIGTGGKNGE